MKNNEIKKRLNFLSIEYKKLEKHLQIMAQKGLVLKNIENTLEGGSFATFIKTQPTNLRYCADATKNLNNDYLDMCKASGWHYICDFNTLHIFVTQDDTISLLQNDTSIEDELIATNVYKKEILRLFKVSLINLLVAIFFTYLIFKDSLSAFPHIIIAIIILGLLYGCCIYSIIAILYTRYSFINHQYHNSNSAPIIKYSLIYPTTFLWIPNSLYIFIISDSNLFNFKELVLIIVGMLILLIIFVITCKIAQQAEL